MSSHEGEDTEGGPIGELNFENKISRRVSLFGKSSGPSRCARRCASERENFAPKRSVRRTMSVNVPYRTWIERSPSGAQAAMRSPSAGSGGVSSGCHTHGPCVPASPTNGGGGRSDITPSGACDPVSTIPPPPVFPRRANAASRANVSTLSLVKRSFRTLTGIGDGGAAGIADCASLTALRVSADTRPAFPAFNLRLRIAAR